jgi:hypothetical protein
LVVLCESCASWLGVTCYYPWIMVGYWIPGYLTVAGKEESERTTAGTGGKRGWWPEEGLPWPKRSDRGIGGGRDILDLDGKDACN